MISCFPIDYMHNTCLGVMRKLLFCWRDGNRRYRICGQKLIKFEENISLIRQTWPSEFNRKPRTLKDLERWKATELRQFLLYVGPVILEKILPPHLYSHFMILKFAMTILLSDTLNKEYNKYANLLMKVFVEHAPKIYGKEICTYNMHSLVHLADEAALFGNLNTINCFPFENHLYTLKRMLRKPNLPLQQVIHRIYEKKNRIPTTLKQDIFVHGKKIGANSISENGSEEMRSKYIHCELYTKLTFASKKFQLSRKFGNNIVILNNLKIVECLYYLENDCDFIVIGRDCNIVKSFTGYPEDSKMISLFEIELTDDCLFDFLASNIKHKGVILCLDEKTVFSPLSHVF